MRARDLAEPVVPVRLSTPATEATELLVRERRPGLVVLDDDDQPLMVLPASQVLRFALPEYVEEDESLARMYSEDESDHFCATLDGHTVGELLPSREYLPRSDRDRPIVDGDATLIEVAAAMARQHSPITAVVEQGRLIGVITVHRLLGAALPGA